MRKEKYVEEEETNEQTVIRQRYTQRERDEGKDGMKVNAICRDISVYINITRKNINLNTCRSYLYMTVRQIQKDFCRC